MILNRVAASSERTLPQYRTQRIFSELKLSGVTDLNDIFFLRNCMYYCMIYTGAGFTGLDDKNKDQEMWILPKEQTR